MEIIMHKCCATMYTQYTYFVCLKCRRFEYLVLREIGKKIKFGVVPEMGINESKMTNHP